MRCKNCGAELEPDSAFCTNCGAPVTNETCPNCGSPLNDAGECDVCGGYTPHGICPNCGEPLDDNSIFCIHCGAKVGQSEPPTWNVPPHQPQMSNREKGKGRGVLIGILSGVIVLLLAAAAAIVLNVTGVIDLNGIFNGGQPQETAEASPSPSAAPNYGTSPTHSAKPTASPTLPPTPAPTPNREHTYRVITDHITWEEARDAAVRAGGHLVTFNSREEFNKVVSLLSSYSSVRIVWIGACAPVGLTSAAAAADYWNSPDATWITGEPFTFAKWRSGEPSGYDAGLGTEERYIQIFRPKSDGGEWSYNDAGSDLSEYKPDTLAYVIEFE